MATKISRRTARESAIKLLFGYGFVGEESPADYFERTVEECELEVNDFTKSLFSGVLENITAIDEKIAAHAVGWKMNRIARMSLTVLRLCTYELLFTDVPVEIAINEAVELAKAFDSDSAPAFVNGVLNTIAKEARA